MYLSAGVDVVFIGSLEGAEPACSLGVNVLCSYVFLNSLKDMLAVGFVPCAHSDGATVGCIRVAHTIQLHASLVINQKSKHVGGGDWEGVGALNEDLLS